MKINITMCSISVLFCAQNTMAKPFEPNDVSFLVSSCREVVEIYSKKNEQRFLAAQTTSMSEAMRAGYCIGVVQQYLRNSNNCSGYGYRQFSKGRWFDFASAIANVSFGKNETSRKTSAKRLLKSVYCND